MSLTVEAKHAVVTEVAAVAKTAQSAVAAEYRGLTVAEMTKFRMAARQADVYVRVVKNTLARRAIEGTSFECMKGSLKGPLVLAFSREDPGAAARVVKGFAKEHEKLVTVALSIGGELYPASDLDRLASLPTLTDVVVHGGLFQIYDIHRYFNAISQSWTLATELSFYLVVPAFAWLVSCAMIPSAMPGRT